ncbi:MAG TPA: GNAT family N-acetyltransferase, partial [Thalassospira sp.]|nr:GNAT family N-acetyltransferase [Thalassospira sp.]
MTTIRSFTDSDADALVEIYRRAVTEIGPRAYNPEQVAVWA